MRNTKDSDEKPSDMFINSLFGYGIGSDNLECGWCGRIHLCPDTDNNHYDDDEYTAEESRQKYRQWCEQEAIDNPNTIVLHYDCDALSAHEMNGILFVIGCPCNGLYRYEKFIWDHKDTIKNYLRIREEQEIQWAKEELTFNKLIGI